eukprot:GHVR01088118.1.p1 GENE.GHVR01088118.1~~GHVR01088118.1.p1  ORF type:complete len:454 (-),score=44.22 GHVR01088118.1:572-1933(-)
MELVLELVSENLPNGTTVFHSANEEYGKAVYVSTAQSQPDSRLCVKQEGIFTVNADVHMGELKKVIDHKNGDQWQTAADKVNCLMDWLRHIAPEDVEKLEPCFPISYLMDYKCAELCVITAFDPHQVICHRYHSTYGPFTTLLYVARRNIDFIVASSKYLMFGANYPGCSQTALERVFNSHCKGTTHCSTVHSVLLKCESTNYYLKLPRGMASRKVIQRCAREQEQRCALEQAREQRCTLEELMEENRGLRLKLRRLEVPCGSTSRAGNGGVVHSDAEVNDSTMVGGAERAVMLEHILMEGATIVTSHYHNKLHFWKVPAFSPLKILCMEEGWQIEAVKRCISIMQHCKEAVDCDLFHNDIRRANVVSNSYAKLIDWDFSVPIVEGRNAWQEYVLCPEFGVRRVQQLVESCWGSSSLEEADPDFVAWTQTVTTELCKTNDVSEALAHLKHRIE